MEGDEMSKSTNRIGPCREADKRWVQDWYNSVKHFEAYLWVKRMHRGGWTWHQIRSYINGSGMK